MLLKLAAVEAKNSLLMLQKPAGDQAKADAADALAKAKACRKPAAATAKTEAIAEATKLVEAFEKLNAGSYRQET